MIPVRTPYNWNAITSFLAKRAIRGVESFDGDTYTRGLIQVRFTKNALITNGEEARVRRLFDADTHPRTIAAHLSRDRTLAPLVAKHRGIRVPGTWDPFELTVRAIVGQQISVAGATTILSRIAEKHGGILADRIADSTIEGMPRRRADNIVAIARMVARGEASLERRASLDETISALRALPGIGPWTAHYIAMRLGEPDAFPAGDLWLRRAAGNVSERELEKIAERWRPWRAYAALLLWTV
ncbi:MAG TPA: AlkA N-terminal domain-containing protein [Thermoanaerobaculia bacterium]|nr:AlkA N-terminal domain-containing protein [Thermoanaerobaculia bacterium]